MLADSMRRLMDLSGSSLGLILLSPVIVLTAAIIKLDSPGPVLYIAQRVGKNGKPFRLYKFRTMAASARCNGPAVTGAHDTRITRSGRLLRGTKLDELPQLLNVLRGDMSLVGPRPEDARYVELYTPAQRAVLSVRPGITSAASLAYRHESALLSGPDWEHDYIYHILPHKLAIELDYLAHRTVASDVRLVIRTIVTLPAFHWPTGSSAT